MAVTSAQGADAPRAARSRPWLFWSRLHFLIRLLGLTGGLLASLPASLPPCAASSARSTPPPTCSKPGSPAQDWHKPPGKRRNKTWPWSSAWVVRQRRYLRFSSSC